jgi:aspartate/tyrosine/aromatic aminotransferase
MCGLLVQLPCVTIKHFISVLSAASDFFLLCPSCHLPTGQAMLEKKYGVVFGKMTKDSAIVQAK